MTSRVTLRRWSRRLRRWLRPPRMLRPTKAGWYFTAITFGVGFAALNTGNNLLYLVLSLMLSFLVLSGVLSESALRGIEVRRRLPTEIFAGRPNPVVVDIHNSQQRVPSFAVVVEDQVRCEARPADTRGELQAAGRAFALRVGPGGCESRTYRLRPRQRGELCFAGFRVSTRFPFGLFVKSLEIEAPVSALVFPRLDPVSLPPTLGPQASDAEAPSTGRGEGSQASALRDFEEGDSFRRVHWRSSLRRGELVVRELEREQQHEVEVSLRRSLAPGRTESAPEEPQQEGFERQVRQAASEAVAWLERGMHVALRTDDERIGPGAGPAQRRLLLSFLARLDAPSGPMLAPRVRT